MPAQISACLELTFLAVPVGRNLKSFSIWKSILEFSSILYAVGVGIGTLAIKISSKLVRRVIIITFTITSPNRVKTFSTIP